MFGHGATNAVLSHCILPTRIWPSESVQDTLVGLARRRWGTFLAAGHPCNPNSSRYLRGLIFG